MVICTGRKWKTHHKQTKVSCCFGKGFLWILNPKLLHQQTAKTRCQGTTFLGPRGGFFSFRSRFQRFHLFFSQIMIWIAVLFQYDTKHGFKQLNHTSEVLSRSLMRSRMCWCNWMYVKREKWNMSATTTKLFFFLKHTSSPSCFCTTTYNTITFFSHFVNLQGPSYVTQCPPKKTSLGAHMSTSSLIKKSRDFLEVKTKNSATESSGYWWRRRALGDFLLYFLQRGEQITLED